MSARDAFSSQAEIDRQWQKLNFTDRPDFERAVQEHGHLVEILHGFGIETVVLPHADEGTLDAIYVRDASVATDRGIVLCSMGKESRRAEPVSQEAQFRAWGLPILGEIGGEGRLEGGDVAWLNERTVAVGRGYR
ncbi:MAG: arginine deiminase family protein, partial [Gemmatimonadota bacterium]|nr:arginine deiminase family protein [Gemmatimonadota bacterium]